MQKKLSKVTGDSLADFLPFPQTAISLPFPSFLSLAFTTSSCPTKSTTSRLLSPRYTSLLHSLIAKREAEQPSFRLPPSLSSFASGRFPLRPFFRSPAERQDPAAREVRWLRRLVRQRLCPLRRRRSRCFGRHDPCSAAQDDPHRSSRCRYVLGPFPLLCHGRIQGSELTQWT
jgi:hypothetical protein